MRSTTVNIYDVQVIFDAGDKAFGYMGDVAAGSNSIPVASGIQMVNFKLSTINGSGATFDFYPINWVGTPDMLPAAGLGQWFDANRCRLVVFNSHTSTTPVSYGFVLTVMHEGVAYTSPDPTIINEPPVGG